jgi:hypothetical protein
VTGDEIQKKRKELKNVEKRWENEAKYEWDALAQSLVPYANLEKPLLQSLSNISLHNFWVFLNGAKCLTLHV